MTGKIQKIKEWISKTQDGLMDDNGNFEYQEHEGAYNILCNLDAYIDSMQEESVSMWHDSGEMPQEKKVCLIRYSANDGASTNNFEVVIAEPLTRRFVTRSYPHKTGYQHTIHGENTIKVDEYQDRREYIPFSDIDEWAYIDDLLNLPNVQRAVKNWKEPVSEDLEKAAEQDVCEVVNECSATGIPNDHIPSWVQDAMANEFIHGAKWQKEQMMAKGVDGVVHHFEKCGVASVHYKDPTGVPMSYFMSPKGIFAGDKVKIIVIKED